MLPRLKKKKNVVTTPGRLQSPEGSSVGSDQLHIWRVTGTDNGTGETGCPRTFLQPAHHQGSQDYNGGSRWRHQHFPGGFVIATTKAVI